MALKSTIAEAQKKGHSTRVDVPLKKEEKKSNYYLTI